MAIDWLLSFYDRFLLGPLVVAIIVFALLKAKTVKRYSICALVIVVLLLPLLRRELGTIYFNHLCQTEAGEFIYKTVDNVEGVFQMRLRDGSKDYFDRMRQWDIPEDPYGHTNWEAQHPQTLFIGPPWRNYQFFENPLLANDGVPSYWRRPTIIGKKELAAKYRRFYGYSSVKNTSMIEDHVAELNSRYGYTWQGSSDLGYWLFGIHAGETVIRDLRTNEILGEKRGFIRFRPWAICPRDKVDDFMYKFISKVLKPSASEIK